MPREAKVMHNESCLPVHALSEALAWRPYLPVSRDCQVPRTLFMYALWLTYKSGNPLYGDEI